MECLSLMDDLIQTGDCEEEKRFDFNRWWEVGMLVFLMDKKNGFDVLDKSNKILLMK